MKWRWAQAASGGPTSSWRGERNSRLLGPPRGPAAAVRFAPSRVSIPPESRAGAFPFFASARAGRDRAPRRLREPVDLIASGGEPFERQATVTALAGWRSGIFNSGVGSRRLRDPREPYVQFRDSRYRGACPYLPSRQRPRRYRLSRSGFDVAGERVEIGSPGSGGSMAAGPPVPPFPP